ncbi:MAG: endonuclease, partial [bacterium]
MEPCEVRDLLLSIKGIGPETADSILLYALDLPIFVIDAYTKRILSRIGIVSNKATYQELQDLFHNKLPTDIELFNDYHAQLVVLAKDFCNKKPKCSECPLRIAGICCFN